MPRNAFLAAFCATCALIATSVALVRYAPPGTRVYVPTADVATVPDVDDPTLVVAFDATGTLRDPDGNNFTGAFVAYLHQEDPLTRRVYLTRRTGVADAGVMSFSGQVWPADNLTLVTQAEVFALPGGGLPELAGRTERLYASADTMWESGLFDVFVDLSNSSSYVIDFGVIELARLGHFATIRIAESPLAPSSQAFTLSFSRILDRYIDSSAPENSLGLWESLSHPLQVNSQQSLYAMSGSSNFAWQVHARSAANQHVVATGAVVNGSVANLVATAFGSVSGTVDAALTANGARVVLTEDLPDTTIFGAAPETYGLEVFPASYRAIVAAGGVTYRILDVPDGKYRVAVQDPETWENVWSGGPVSLSGAGSVVFNIP